MLGDGGTAWSPFEIQNVGSYSAELGDIDEDGDWDIVGIRNWDSPPTEIWRNTLVEPIPPFTLDQWEYVEVDNNRVRWQGSLAARSTSRTRISPCPPRPTRCPTWRA